MDEVRGAKRTGELVFRDVEGERAVKRAVHEAGVHGQRLGEPVNCRGGGALVEGQVCLGLRGGDLESV
ncbi:hypothetical protein [Amycolatopsis sp. WGS_07]|uniref:hypothetical protein n=1 Tax=Amycolatopsis sp. WGS_07 TaxID=3076764 RepID=UPI003873BA6C